jgi:hypothetical protein
MREIAPARQPPLTEDLETEGIEDRSSLIRAETYKDIGQKLWVVSGRTCDDKSPLTKALTSQRTPYLAKLMYTRAPGV